MNKIKYILVLSLAALIIGCGSNTNVNTTSDNSTMETMIFDGLTWNAGPAELMTFDKALTYCEAKGMQLREQNALGLNFIHHQELANPAGAYWTSGESELDDNEVYVVDTSNGGMFIHLIEKSEEHYVRCFK